uniref:Uncharacterized protein n=1 Tax=viral metagenome TaxID=1070528 RepID=A0A6C0EUP5_9ZZZZ
MENINNDELRPLDVFDDPWLYYNNHKYDIYSINNVGKWMLFYDKSLMNEAWIIAKKLYRENKLDGVFSMKCSTNYENPRASSKDDIIILYCSNSSNEEQIMKNGKNILIMFDYKEQHTIYYKTDLQTLEGTKATGTKLNHAYKLFNPLYKSKCLIKIPGFN